MLAHLTFLLIHFIQSAGYGGVFLLMFLGSALIPIPSEVVLPFTGFLTSKGVFNYPLAVLVAVVADLAGSLVLYYIGYILEENLLLRLIKRHGKFVLLSEQEYLKASSWFVRYGSGVVLVAKIIPGLRYLISLPAGVLKMNLGKYITFSLIGSIIWCSGMIYLGIYLGNRWTTLGPLFSKFQDIIIVFVLLLIALYVNHKMHFVRINNKHKK